METQLDMFTVRMQSGQRCTLQQIREENSVTCLKVPVGGLTVLKKLV